MSANRHGEETQVHSSETGLTTSSFPQMTNSAEDVPTSARATSAIAPRRTSSQKSHFSPAGSAVTGLHCIGSMNAGSVRFRIVCSFVVFASSSLISLGKPN